MNTWFSEGAYRAFLFFFVPLALVHLAFPGRNPLRKGRTASRAHKREAYPDPSGVLAFVPRSPTVRSARPSAYRCRKLAR